MNLTQDRRDELRRNSERMMRSCSVVAPYSISPDEVLSLLDEAEGARINLSMAEANCEELERQVNKLIESCYYRTKAGKVHWKQGQWFGTSTADNTDPAAFEQAMAAIRRNAGISEDDGAGEDEVGSDDPAPESRHDWCADANCETCNRRWNHSV